MKDYVISAFATLSIMSAAFAQDELPTILSLEDLYIDGEVNRNTAAQARTWCRTQPAANQLTRPCMDACFNLLRGNTRQNPIEVVAQNCADQYNALRNSVGAPVAVEEPIAIEQDVEAAENDGAKEIDIAAVTPNPEEPATADASTLSALSDPAAQYCLSNSKVNKLWDCACIDENASAARKALSDRQFEYSSTTTLPRRMAALERAKDNVAKETNPVRMPIMKKAVERLEAEVSGLQNPPDPMSFPDSKVIQEIEAMKVCRSSEKIAEERFLSCQSSVSSLSGVTDGAAYCACVSEKTAAAWSSGEIETYSSNALRNVGRPIDQACRG